MQCKRVYGDEDFDRTFCPCCAPIAISEELVERYKENKRLIEILGLIQSMLENGFFP
jgi:hypothetical protein